MLNRDNIVPGGEERATTDPHAKLPLEQQLDSAPVMTVAVGSLRGAATPRLSGENLEHIRLLAQSETTLPPIIIHRQTMRVIDGMHRLHAARLRGAHEIPAQFYDGTAADAFVLAVKVNTAHGLPLSLADRKAAAARIIASHPQWSDRAIAEVTALSHKTVGAIRRRPDGELPQMDARIGQDGRIRPLNAAAGRSRAADLLRAHPGASLRQVAAAAGISPETARDVRTRLRNGGDPLLPRQRRGWPAGPGGTPPPPGYEPGGPGGMVPPGYEPGGAGGMDPSGYKKWSGLQPRRAATPQPLAGHTLTTTALARKLRRDPALRSSATIQALVALLAQHPADPAQWRQIATGIPSRWAAPVAAAATECARAWHAFATQVRQNTTN